MSPQGPTETKLESLANIEASGLKLWNDIISVAVFIKSQTGVGNIDLKMLATCHSTDQNGAQKSRFMAET